MGNKAIFVGLGGAGVQAVAHLKAKMLRMAADANDLATDCSFIFIDSASDQVDRMNSHYFSEFPERLIQIGAELVSIGGVNPKKMFEEATNNLKRDQAGPIDHQLLSYISTKSAHTWKNASLEQGASGSRQLGRTGILGGASAVRNAVLSAVSGLVSQFNKDEQKSENLPVYLFSGTCGGTASSSFLDVAFLIDRTIKEAFKQDEVSIRAILFLPPEFVAINGAQWSRDKEPRYIENGFAFFRELEYFLRDRYVMDFSGYTGGEAFSRISVLGSEDERLYGIARQFRIFSFAVCIDNMSELGGKFTLDQMVTNAAELVYYWHMGDVQDGVIAGADNHLTGEYTKSSYTDYETAMVPAFAGMGYRALQFPKELLREYFRKRFLFEFFNYGVLGADYKDALKEAERLEEVNSTVEKCIDDAIKPLTDLWDKKAGENTQAINDSSFRSVGILNRIIKTENPHGDLDTDKIGNSFEINNLIRTAETVVKEMEKIMALGFNGSSNTGREKIIKFIKYGNTDLTGNVSNGPSIENAVENAILRVGLKYSKAFVEEVEEKILSKIETLTKEREGLESIAKKLKSDREGYKSLCLSGSKKEKIKGINGLINTLKSQIETFGNLGKIDQQLTILNDLSLGNQGVLDKYAEYIGEMINVVTGEVNGKGEGDSRVVGLMGDFKVELAKQFNETSNNVTTTYIPDVSSFSVEDNDNDFAKLYRSVVEMEQHTGGLRPVRFGTKSMDGHIRDGGLHKVFQEMLADAQITEREGGWQENGQFTFFRGHFKRGTAQRMYNSLYSYAVKYIDKAMEGSSEVRIEVEMPLLKRFEGLGLKQRQQLKDYFSDSKTQLFCSFERSIDQHSIIVYAAQTEELAATLGFNGSDKQQFVKIDDPHRFLKLKFSGLRKLEDLSFYRNYEGVYTKAFQKQSDFFRHIHKELDEFGIDKGMERILASEAQKDIAGVTLGLFYWRILEEAKLESSFLTNVILIDSNEAGSDATKEAPVFTESIGSGESAVTTVSVASTVSMKYGKIYLRSGDFVKLGGAESYLDIYKEIIKREDRASILKAFTSFDEFFRKSCTAEWGPKIKSAADKMRKQLKEAIEESVNDDKRAYESMTNALNGFEKSLYDYVLKQKTLGVDSQDAKPKIKHF